MTTKQLDRLLKLAEKFVSAYAKMVDIQEKRLASEFPPPGEPVEAQFVKVGEGNVDQPESKAEYDEFPVDEPGAFQKVLSDLKARSEAG